MDVIRSFISAYHDDFYGVKAGMFTEITEVITSVWNKRPSQPRYKNTWSVGQVLRALVPELSCPELKQITLKVTMLMVLCSASRASKLDKLTLFFKKDGGPKITFTMPVLTKTRRAGTEPVGTEPLLRISNGKIFGRYFVH